MGNWHRLTAVRVHFYGFIVSSGGNRNLHTLLASADLEPDDLAVLPGIKSHLPIPGWQKHRRADQYLGIWRYPYHANGYYLQASLQTGRSDFPHRTRFAFSGLSLAWDWVGGGLDNSSGGIEPHLVWDIDVESK